MVTRVGGVVNAAINMQPFARRHFYNATTAFTDRNIHPGNMRPWYKPSALPQTGAPFTSTVALYSVPRKLHQSPQITPGIRENNPRSFST